MAARGVSDILLFITASFLSASSASRILMIPIPMRSHIQVLVSIAAELSGRGHQVHFFYPGDTSLPAELKDTSNNITVHIYDRPSFDAPKDFEEMNDEQTQQALSKSLDGFNVIKRVFSTSASSFECRNSRSCVECLRILEPHNDKLFTHLENIQFDMAVVGSLFFMKCLYLVPHRLHIPYISFANGIEPWIVRTPYLPSFVPMVFTGYSDRMNFIQRAKNSLFWWVFSLVGMLIGPPTELLERYRKDYGYFRTLDELAINSSFWLTNYHILSHTPKPAMPNVADVGGLTVKPASTEPLPADIEAFIAGAPKGGVVLMTFGSMASVFPPEMAQKFIDAFSSLKDEYYVIWRVNNQKMKLELPGNVFVSNWLPQNELLANERIKLFVTHGGLNGQLESIYHAKPMIGFPLFADQWHNTAQMARRGYGVELNIHSFTVEEFAKSIREVITNPYYKTQIKKASEIFHTDIQRPTEKAAWWIEHVIKYGHGHLTSAGNDLYWFQYWLLDVVGFFVLAIFMLGTFVCLCCRCCFRRCCSAKSNYVRPNNREKKQKRKDE